MHRKESVGDLKAGAASQAIAAYDGDVAAGLITVRPHSAAVTKFESVVRRCFELNPPIFVRTLDAIHLATALEVNELQIVVTDKRLRQAAENWGLTLYPVA